MRRWLPLLTICIGTFMLLIDVTIVNVALPSMVEDLHASFGALQWVVDAYALTLAALLLGVGSVADLVGHRRAYVAGLAVFAISSFVCGIAPSSGTLIAARAVQGVGAAAMFATTFALLNSSYAGRDRGTAFGVWGAVAGASAAIGPILGGLLTEAASWRWIFFVNLPASLAAMALCAFVLTDVHETVRRRVDVLGMLAFSGAAACATYALIRANERGWSNAGSWWLLALAGALLAAFVWMEARSSHPLLDLELLRRRSFVGVLVAGILLPFAAFAAFTYTSIWLQSVLGLSPIEAGLTGFPMSAMAFLVSATVSRHLHARRTDHVIGGGLLLIGLGGVVTTLLVHGSASWPALVPGYMLIGVGVGIATPILGSVAMSLVPPQRGGMAAGAVNTMRQLGFAFGIAALGSIFAARAQSSLDGRGIAEAGRAARAVAGGRAHALLGAAPSAARGAVDDAVHAAAVHGVQATFAVSGLVGLAAAALVLVLMRPAAAPAPAHAAPLDERAAAPEPARD
jgi:EmrB/QacA subfamily drug resistance transporter